MWGTGGDTSYYEWSNVILQNGNVGALLALDSIGRAGAGYHCAFQFYRKGIHAKATIFRPGPTEGA